MREEALQAGSLRQLAYDEIRSMILDGKLRSGEVIEEKRLMEQLGVGRTPLREAVNQLQQEDVVEIIPRRGTFVRPLDAQDISSLYQAREVMEPAIARIATPVVETEVLRMYQKSFCAPCSMPEMIRLDCNFHRYLTFCTHNRYFQRFMESVYFQNERIRGMSTRAIDNHNDTNTEHLAIVARMLERDQEGAAKAMQEHITHSRETALALVFGLMNDVE